MGTGENVAVTLVAALSVTGQVLVPEQAPLQPAKTEPLPGVAVSVTDVPGAKDAEQVPAVQLSPLGDETTVPAPVPVSATVSAYWEGTENEAETEVAALRVTWQVPVPEQAPLQPPKLEPLPGVAVRVTTVPCAKVAEHCPVVQPMPAGAELTVPCPLPARLTVSAYWGTGEKVAVTAVAALTVSAQVPVPEQAPLQPMKTEPSAGVAVKVTEAP